jgi:DNA excision repair protein ERCC-6
MALGRKVSSILIVCPATMLQHWLSELSTWAPGLRRVLIHQSGEVDGMSRTISPKLLRTLDKWLRRARADRVNEPIDEEDLENMDEDSFCGTGYVVITTFENVRRSPDIWTAHNWGYCVLDEGQKIRNPDADVTLACKRLRTPHRLLLSGTPIQNDLRGTFQSRRSPEFSSQSHALPSLSVNRTLESHGLCFPWPTWDATRIRSRVC